MSIDEHMKEVCDAAHNFVGRWNHTGRCRICDEAMEVLIKKLGDLAHSLDEPVMSKAVCGSCGHRWNAFCPEGLKVNVLECPQCGKDKGMLEEESDE